MSGLIEAQIARAERLGESGGLLEDEAESRAGDGVDGAGRIADERDRAPRYRRQAAVGGDTGALGWRAAEAVGDGGKGAESVVKAQVWIARDEHDAGFAFADGCDVELAAATPMELDEIAPGRDGVMTAEAEAAAVAAAGIETGPAADAGLRAIGADDPAGADFAAAGVDDAAFNAGDGCAPQQANAERRGAIDHDFVQRGAAQAKAGTGAKFRLGGQAAGAETDAAKRMACRLPDRDAQRARGGDAVRHDAFAAGLVDGRAAAIGHGDVETEPPGGDRGSQTGWTSADDADVGGDGKRTDDRAHRVFPHFMIRTRGAGD